MATAQYNLRSKTSTSLLDLPVEVRLNIYRKLFTGTRLDFQVFNRDNRWHITRIEDCPSKLHLSLLETCVKFNNEALPLLAAAMMLTIHYYAYRYGRFDGADESNLDLTDLFELPFAPPFLLRVKPFLTKLTYLNHKAPGVCKGLEAVPSLSLLCVRNTITSLKFDKLPHLDKHCLQNPDNLDAKIALTARKYILREAVNGWEDLRKLATDQNRKFKLLYGSNIYFGYHMRHCDAGATTCLCRDEIFSHAVLDLPTLEFDVEIVSEEEILVDKWFVWYEERYDTYEALEVSLRIP